MLNLKNNETVRQCFRDLKVLTVHSIYNIFECILFIQIFKKKVSYNGVKFLKFIPKHIKIINNNKHFKIALKEFLLNNQVFYSLQEFDNLKIQ